MSSKFEEIIPIKLGIVVEKIGHKKFTKESVREFEGKIMEALQYQITSASPYDYVGIICQKLVQSTSQPTRDTLSKLTTYVIKLMLFDYNIVSAYTNSEIAAVAIHVAGLIMKQQRHANQIDLQYEILRLKNTLIIEEKKHKQLLERTIYLYNNFNEVFPNMINLDKFHDYDELVDKVLLPS